MPSKSKTPLTDIIVGELIHGVRSKDELLGAVLNRTKCTRQGYFKALRQLKQEETVTVHGNSVSLSFLWIQKQADLLAAIEKAYQVPAYRSYFGELQEGQTNAYTFRTLDELELFWTHIIIVLVENALRDETIMAITPHDWFELLRPHTSNLWDERFSHIPHRVINTHATSAERKFALHKKVKNVEYMFNVNPLKQEENTYINVIGNYVFEATFDDKAVAYIKKAMSTGVKELPEACLHEKGKYKLKVQNNPKKALAIKKKISKYFTTSLL